MKILLQGYIGHRNFGDDLLLKLAIDNVKGIRNVEVYCILQESLDANYLTQYYPQIKIITYKKAVPIFFYKKFDKVYFIGGGVFFDYRKTIDFKSYLKKKISNYLRFNIPRIIFGAKYAGIGIGIGPFKNSKSKKIYKNLLQNFDLLGVRDYTSFEHAKSFGVKNIHLSNDSSLLLNEDLKMLKKQSKTPKRVVISPRSYKHDVSFEKHLETLIEFTNYLKGNGYEVKWCFLQPEDENLISKLELNQIDCLVWEPTNMSLVDFISYYASASLVYTSRMHTVYIAGLLSVDTVAIRVHQKLEFASKLFNNEPKMLNPKAGLKDYINCFEGKTNFNKEKFEKEYDRVKQLNDRMKSWLLK